MILQKLLFITAALFLFAATSQAEVYKNTNEFELKSLSEILAWRWSRERAPKPKAFPTEKPDLETLQKRGGALWIGHATVLFQIDETTILTDPQFSDYAAPFSFVGPERFTKPAILIKDLPPIDVVVISHNHFDHLDIASVTALNEKSLKAGDDTLFIVPLGLKSWFLGIGITNVVEVAWWASVEKKGVQFTSAKVQHFSRRAAFDTNKSQWAGWAIKGKNQNVYFAGDTGYGPDFIEAGKRLGPFDLAAIPIGAYNPAKLMKTVHLNPKEAVQVHLDIKAKKSFAIHWGTFYDLTDEPLDEPPKKLKLAKEEASLQENEFVVLKFGEALYFE